MLMEVICINKNILFTIPFMDHSMQNQKSFPDGMNRLELKKQVVYAWNPKFISKKGIIDPSRAQLPLSRASLPLPRVELPLSRVVSVLKKFQMLFKIFFSIIRNISSNSRFLKLM